MRILSPNEHTVKKTKHTTVASVIRTALRKKMTTASKSGCQKSQPSRGQRETSRIKMFESAGYTNVKPL